MFMRHGFELGRQYAINFKAHTCVQLTSYGRQLHGVQKAILDVQGERYVTIRWPNGEVNRITKE